MKANEPLLSVVIPTRNRRDMALQAARSALETLPFPYEILLSDNASTDGTPELATLLPEVRYVRRPELLPMAQHWNRCVAEARGKYVKLLCDDDWLLPGALAREVACLEAHPDFALVASPRFEVTPEDGRKLRAAPAGSLAGPRFFWQMLVHENLVGPPTSVTFRRSAFRGFPEGYAYAADWAAWVLLAEQGGAGFLKEPGANFRLHGANLTVHYVEDGTDFLEVQSLRRECLRRLPFFWRLAGAPTFAAIFAYRFARRALRYATRRKFAGLGTFLSRAIRFSAPQLDASISPKPWKNG